MLHLVADLGNTTGKFALLKDGELLSMHRTADRGTDALRTFLADSVPDAWIISSVRTDSSEITAYLQGLAPGFVLGHQMPLPINITYETPETLGHDRIAAMVGAWKMFPGKPVLVIDAGTCIKYDILLPDGSFPGGTIAPGLRMRLEAMHTFTGRLPFVEIPEQTWPEGPPVTGTSTAGSLLSGALAAGLLEAEGMIAYYQQNQPYLKVLLTGGDAPFFASRLKSQIFAVPELILSGLDEILRFQFNAI